MLKSDRSVFDKMLPVDDNGLYPESGQNLALSRLANTNLSDLSIVGTCDIFVYQ